MKQDTLFLPFLIVMFATLLGGASAYCHGGGWITLAGALIGLAAGAMAGALLVYASSVLVPLAMFGLVAVVALGWLFG